MAEQVKLTRKEKVAQSIEKAAGNRKRRSSLALKEKRSTTAKVALNDYPTSPRKMRLVIDQIRGKKVDMALGILKTSTKHAAVPVLKLLLAAVNSWQTKNEGKTADADSLFVKEAFVDGGKMLKRFRPAPQGRAYRVRKRSNHVTIILDTKS